MPALAFRPETLRFLRALGKHNDRAWFEERRPVYERAVKQPLLALVEQINTALETFAPEHVRPAHKVALRIFRDVRFSPDKRPYRTHMGAWWQRRGLAKDAGAGFYLQIGPEGSFVAAGLYAPERDSLLAMRRWLAERHEAYREVLMPLLNTEGDLQAMEPLPAEALTRNPKGFPPEHPASDLLRARTWGVTAPLEAEMVTSPHLADTVVRHLRRMAPLVEMLNGPMLHAAEVHSSVLAGAGSAVRQKVYKSTGKGTSLG